MCAVARVGATAENADMSSGARDFIVDVAPRLEFFIAQRPITVERG
jgi:hypothetical protein